MLAQRKAPTIEFPKQNKGNPEEFYIIDRELGSGAYSVVYLGIEKSTNNEYAVKVVDKKNTSSKSMLQEIDVMSKLNHPHVVNFKEIFDTSKGYYVVMEYITGGELFDRIIESHHYTEKDAARVMKEVMLGIAHMHEKMLVHRDLKPENLLLSSRAAEASVKVADFGFARGTVSDHDLTSLVGTPPYMAPELVRLRHYDATGGYGRSVDVWALGVILYILLSGIHPFQIEDEEAMLENIESARWNWLGDNWDTVSESAKDLIKAMLVQDPAKRPDIHAVLKHPWIVNGGASDKELGLGVKDALKQFQARKKFKGAIRAIAATNRMRLAAMSLKPRSDSTGAHHEDVEYFPYDDLINGQPLPDGVPGDSREKHLSDKDFLRVFAMDKESFFKLPEEKRAALKKDKKLL